MTDFLTFAKVLLNSAIINQVVLTYIEKKAGAAVNACSKKCLYKIQYLYEENQIGIISVRNQLIFHPKKHIYN